MSNQDLVAALRSDPGLEILGVDEHHQLSVRCRRNGLVTRMPITVIPEHAWYELGAIFHGRRQPKNMRHITRIVGYYAFTYNWNESKKAELRDRRKGNYLWSGWQPREETIQ